MEIAAGWVTFTYKDNQAKGPLTGQAPEKELRLPAVEFIRRFLWHVLPVGFVRVRHYGAFDKSTDITPAPEKRNYPGVGCYWVWSLSYLQLGSWVCENGWRPLSM